MFTREEISYRYIRDATKSHAPVISADGHCDVTIFESGVAHRVINTRLIGIDFITATLLPYICIFAHTGRVSVSTILFVFNALHNSVVILLGAKVLLQYIRRPRIMYKTVVLEQWFSIRHIYR